MLFLLRALKRTQRMMSPEHYVAEYDLARSRAASGSAANRRVRVEPNGSLPVHGEP